MARVKQAMSYGPDPVLASVWLVLFGAPFFLWTWLVVRDGFRADLMNMYFIIALMPISVAVFLFRFRVTFTPDTFIYRRWGPTIKIPYAAIERIEVTNSTPLERQAVGAFLVTKEGERFPFWPKLFPRAAVTRFFELAEQRQV